MLHTGVRQTLGIVKEGTRGLDVVCIQAKRWMDRVVGSPEITAFAGGMGAHKARQHDNNH